MADLIQNVQEVYKKWESRSPSFGSRGRRRDLQHGSGNSYRGYGRSGHQFDKKITYDRPGERRFQQRTRTSYVKIPKYDGLAQFKMAPCVTAPNKQRPFVGACCPKCFPMSRASVADKSVFCLSVCNVLHIPLLQSLNFNLVLNILKKNQHHLYPDVSIDVLQDEKICDVVENAVKGFHRESDTIESESSAVLKSVQFSRAKDIYESLKTSISTTCLQASSFILQSVFSRIFDSILVHKGHIEILKATNQGNIPLLYLPVHHNNLDYVLISFILYMSSLKVPLVALDNNLYIPVLGWFTRLLGAFYIRRYLEHDRREKDFVQSAVIHSYLTECLKAGHNLEFFIENESSKSGQLHIPRSELLSFVVESVAEGKVDDVYISTVSVSYEKITEANFMFQQLGETKREETFFAKLYRYWKMLHFNLGNVRINFGQPFSLQEFLENSKLKIYEKLNLDTPPSSPSSHPLQDPHLCSVVNKLVQHVIYDTTYSTSLMATHLVAFLFITQYRKGATQQQLQNSLDWLRGELANKKRDAGFTGESLPVIKRAVELLGKDLISLETIEVEWTSSDLENNNIKVIMYKPVTQLPHVLELQYYANYVVPVFLLDSMIVNALYALVDVEICHFRHCDSKLYVVREKVIDKAVELSDILQFEFTTVPPCTDVIGGTAGIVRYSNTSHLLSFEASEDEEDDCSILKQQQLKIDLKEDSINHFEFLRSILSPYIESYWLAAITLLKLIDEIKEEKVLIHEMQITAQEKLCKGLLAYEESFSAVTFKNALRLFEHWQIVEHYLQDEIKILYLNENYNCKERINDVIARIEEFRK
ncbi:Glycerol-3-phosphate acyltransferase 1 like protein [Argiope bruennichi]|uniref:Glycerol-3-phosphate acyltransferase 1 like protein n=1 Tax=Argiope bruennichi TaxID=94029 RepID=A0A8T0FET6_ARGBR|nr:Glycerol-3-phosphate acyltransferase 1 like protein [Argiope bruennichi]